MNVRTATVLEVDQDVQTARTAARGILAAASNLRTADAGDLLARAKKVAAIAADHAAAVDRDSRFPDEAIAAARAERLLGIAVPHELGGEGASIADVVDICYALGRACASTAMIYAMHQTKVACLVRHGRSQRLASAFAAPARQRATAARVVDHRRTGRRRRAQQRRADRAQRLAHRPRTAGHRHLLRQGGRRHRHHRAPRRRRRRVPIRFWSPSSSRTTRSSRSVGWDAFGMRGTCSEGFKLVASGSSEQILPVSYDKIHAQTMMPVAHLLWSARLGRHRHRRGRARPRLRPQCRATRRRNIAAGRRASDARQRVAADAAQPDRQRSQRFEAAAGRSGGARNHRFSDRHESAQGQRLGACRRDRHERDADLRACRATATTASSASAGICATSCRRRS